MVAGFFYINERGYDLNKLIDKVFGINTQFISSILRMF
jgi:hypothetical protein